MNVLTAALMLLLLVFAEGTHTVGRLSYVMVGRYGRKVGTVLLVVATFTSLASVALPRSLVSVFVTFLAERVFQFICDEDLHDAKRCLDRTLAHQAESAANVRKNHDD